MKHTIAICMLALASAGLTPNASADGFVAVGGHAEGCHFATESAIAAHSADSDGAIHHGILWPYHSADAAGVEAVAVAAASLSLSFDGATLTATGASTSALACVTAMDGRTVASITLADGTADLSALARGIYIVRVTDGAAMATIKIAR